MVFGFAHEARQKVVVDRDKKLIGPHSRPGTDAIKLFYVGRKTDCFVNCDKNKLK